MVESTNKGGAPEGNANATKNKPWIAAVNRAIAQGDADRLRNIAEKMLLEAEKGEAWAIKELGDRLDGKAAQSHEVKIPEGVNINMNFGNGD